MIFSNHPILNVIKARQFSVELNRRDRTARAPAGRRPGVL
jgi:hypothetical protein